jgi:hypothetical protein
VGTAASLGARLPGASLLEEEKLKVKDNLPILFKKLFAMERLVI